MRCTCDALLHLRENATRPRHPWGRPTPFNVVRVFLSSRAVIILFTAAAVINSPGNRNFRKLCGWVEINCGDCRRAAVRVPRCAAFRTFYLLTSHIRTYKSIIYWEPELVPHQYYYYNFRINPLNSKIEISIRTWMLIDDISLFLNNLVFLTMLADKDFENS